MNNMHLPSNSRSVATTWNFPLGIDGFRYADLNRVRRLMALFQLFREELHRSTRPSPSATIGVVTDSTGARGRTIRTC